MKIIGICGSLRKDSYNRKLLLAFAHMLPADFQFEIVEIGRIPLFNADVEKTATPDDAFALCNAIRSAGGVVIATPEYNRGPSSALLNALEWSSRTTDEIWGDKKVFVMGATTGSLGTSAAQYELKRILTYFNAHVVGQPEIMIGAIQDKMDADGKITDERTKDFIQKATDHFVEFVKKG